LPPADAPPGWREIDGDVLRERPLPDHGERSGKGDRGTVLVIGGSRETPGGVQLAGLAAVRAGAGRVHLALGETAALAVAVQFPEARVTPLPETADGALAPSGAEAVRGGVERADVVLVGSGALDADATGDLVDRLLPWIGEEARVVLDAAALHAPDGRPDLVARLGGRAVLMPNPGEMVPVLGGGRDADAVLADPAAATTEAVARHGVAVALRDHTTWIADPDGARLVLCHGAEGLGTPGSGDVLAGVLAGMLARGASPTTALTWAVHAHAVAGCRVHGGCLGLLARELLDELPAVLAGGPVARPQATVGR
jgi:hydroxyethylthiazole kinase-like uncharacterized protein yjeF